MEVVDDGLPIQRSEVEAAIKQMKRGKAIGEDGVAVEMVEASEQYRRSREQWSAINIEQLA